MVLVYFLISYMYSIGNLYLVYCICRKWNPFFCFTLCNSNAITRVHCTCMRNINTQCSIVHLIKSVPSSPLFKVCRLLLAILRVSCQVLKVCAVLSKHSGKHRNCALHEQILDSTELSRLVYFQFFLLFFFLMCLSLSLFQHLYYSNL